MAVEKMSLLGQYKEVEVLLLLEWTQEGNLNKKVHILAISVFMGSGYDLLVSDVQ